MNKKNKAKRYLAGLLTVLMIFQQSGMNSILADSDEIPVTFAAEEELAGYDEVQEYEGQAQVEETVEEPVTEEVMEEEPIQPEETEEPEEPSQPEETGEPEEPSQPEEPGEPEDPSQPEESGDPEETMQPEEPGDSEEPEQPEITEIPKLTATPEPEQTEVPKTDFSYEDESISVTAAAEESAGLPQDAQLKVENLLNTDPQRYEGEKSEMNSLLGIDGEIFTAEYLLYDIYFWSETAGGRVEPADGSVKVQMNFTEPQLVKNTQEQIVQSNLKVYVNRQEDTAAQFDTNEAEAVQGAAFSAVNMGTAAIVRINEMKKNEQLVYTYEDSEVVVTATLAAPDAVPDEAEFRVTRVTPQTAGYNYDVYMQALNNNAEMISPDNSANGQESDVYTEKNTLLYDIAFLVDKTDENGNVIPGEKEEYQPTEGAVNISFDFKKSQLTQEVEAEKAEEIAVVHLPLDEATKESVDTTADATDISAGNINVEVVSEAEVQLETEAADFDLNNFSLVAFVNVNGQELNPGTLQNYWSILGNAIYYGVTANTINKDAHMDTNFATKYFTGSGNVTAGAYTGNNGDANNGGVYVIADMSSDSSLKIDGKNSDVWCTDAIKDRLSLEVDGKGQKTIFAKGALEVYVDRLIASVSKVSASMADEVSYQVKNQNEVMNQAEIDISERPEGTYYIDGDWLNDISEGALRIKKKSDQTIVFNYKGTSVNLKRFEIWDTDRESGYMQSTTSSASADQYARTVVFNMPNATDVTFASGMFGIFLAPKATVHGLGGTSSGWLVVDTLDKNGSEWHCVWSDMRDSSHIPVPAQLTAIKTVNGDRPGDDEKFRFKLEIYNKEWRKWAQVEILPNKGNFVTFTSMTFRADGQYYYRISEYGEVDGYIKDDTVYIAVITVSSDSQISGDTTITSYKIDSVKYYRASDLEEVTEDNLVPAAAFDNTRQEEEKIETSVCKEWDDADNQDGKRPQSILVQLYANGQKLGEPVVLNEGNGWSDLPVKQDGQTVVYSVKEVGRIPGYESTVTGDVQTGFVITNSHTPELTNISGEKIWDDGDNQDGKRPESITVNLFANGEKIDSKAVKADAEGNWKYSFKNLPKYANGQLISYTVTEDAVPEYTAEISGTTIINKYQPGKTSISVVKAWEDGNNQDGLRPTDIKVQLYADGSKQGEEVTLNAGNQWSYTWSDLNEMKSGQKIVYTVEEAGKVTGYDTVISGEAKTGYVITNSHTPELTKISGEKIWDDGNNQDGKRPESITVNLFANGEKIDSKAVKADAEGNWKYSFKNLPKYANGQLISYTVTEDAVPEYTAEISGTTIINKYQPGKTSISVVKAWEDGNNQDGLRPTDIKVQLYADGSKQGEEVTLNAGNQWSYTWSDLNEMKSGQKIVYTVEEAGKVTGYDTVISGEAKTGYVITNSHTPELTNISGEKIWDDGNNQDGKRPESITVNLLANGQKTDSKVVKADKEGNWSYTFQNLPKYANGEPIIYTVTEDTVTDYTTEVTGTTIINKYQPGKTSITVTKAWEDFNDHNGIRPSEIKVQLYADGEAQGEEITLNAEKQWTYIWTDLDERKAGELIDYTVKETENIDNYETTISGDAHTGYIIINTLKTGNLELEKLITGDLSDEKLTAEEKEALTFTITGPYDYQETVYYSDFTDGKYLLSSLPLGEYQVIEANAKIPGYVLTADYSVEEGTTEILHNETATVTITNNYETTSVKISKVDITSHEELEGAHLQIIDQEGNIVDEWDSTKTAHETTGLRTGETYILRETVAPDDYNITNDTTFELNEDGTINTEKTTTTIKDGILLVEDTMKEYSDADLTVTKHLTTNEGEEIKAVDQTFYVALYADEDCTERVSDIKPLVFQNASVSSVTFTKLEKDHTYYVGECDEEGTSYLANVTADGTLYTVEFHDGNVVEIDNPDGSKAIYFDNQFEEIPDNFYRDGKLIITKKLLRADGKAKNSSQTFYAGIFADEEYTQFAEEAEEKIVALDLAGNSKVSRSVTIALPNEGNVTLYVTEVDSAGKPVDGATGFKYEISVENAEITLNQENYQETVEITNKETTPTPTPKPSSTPTPTVTPAIPTSNRTQKTPGSFTGTSTRTAVKTGDTTPIDGFIALLAAAAVVTAAGVYFKRRRKAK